eukprot:c9828_g1_i1.p1 GENE.c9828_g1_i1~~c9828_g1_i1.p1  ORF type:complete len:1145 (-),score=251.81 c9828_g1_i1:786-3815(-)
MAQKYQTDPPYLVKLETELDDDDTKQSRLDLRQMTPRLRHRLGEIEQKTNDRLIAILRAFNSPKKPKFRRIRPFVYFVDQLPEPVYVGEVFGVLLARHSGTWYDLEDFISIRSNVGKDEKKVSYSLPSHRIELDDTTAVMNSDLLHKQRTGLFGARPSSFMLAKTSVPLKMIATSIVYQGLWMMKVNSKGELARRFVKVVGSSAESLALVWTRTAPKNQADSIRVPRLSNHCPLANVLEIRRGQRTTNFGKCNDQVWLNDNVSFSVIYKRRRSPIKTADFVAEANVLEAWLTDLRQVTIIANKEGFTENGNLVKKKWRELGPSHGKLTNRKIQRLFRQLHIRVKARDLKRLMEHYDKDRDHLWNYFEFETLLFDIETNLRGEIKDILARHAVDPISMVPAEFQLFLQNVQKERYTSDQVAGFVRKFQVAEHEQSEPSSAPSTYRRISAAIVTFGKGKKKDESKPSEILRSQRSLNRLPLSLGLLAFVRFLKSEENRLFDPAKNSVYMPLDRPLNHYFIASSHNTYLMGAQYLGDSSVDAYIQAIRRGARCLELDLHDGQDCYPIVVTHGGARTSSINFEAVCRAINDFGFELTNTPIVLSLENHCKPENHLRLAHIFRSVFGERLVLCPPNRENMDTIPSPLELLGKILLKGKGLVPDEDQRERGSSAAPPTQINSTLWRRLTSTVFPDKGAPLELLDGDGETDPEVAMSSNSMRKSLTKKQVVHSSTDELNEVIFLKQYRVRADVKDLDKAIGTSKPWNMTSFNSSTVDSHFHSQPHKFAQFNTVQMSRIYPNPVKPMAWLSGNFSPLKGWKFGSQVVALNYQTFDFPMQVNDAFFSQNGQCGYVLKPDYLCDTTHPFDHTKADQDDRLTHISLKFNIISGQYLQMPEGFEGDVLDPYVVVKVLGIPMDQSTRVTHVVAENGLNPVWNCEFEFQIFCPDLALLYIEVIDKDETIKDTTLGYYCIPFHAMREGYRHFPLKSVDDGTELNPYCTLFCYVEKRVIPHILRK